MVNAAGLAVLAIALTGVVPALAETLGPFGEAASRACCPTAGSSSCCAGGCGLVAYGAVDRAPGPAYLGVANLVAFVVAAGVQRRGDAAATGRR